MTGATYSIAIDDVAVRDMFDELARRAIEMLPAMNEIGSMMAASTDFRFEAGEAPDGTKWEPSQRAIEEGGMTLVDKAHLRNSIEYFAGPGEVEIGTSTIYAAIHQSGGLTGRGHSVDMPARPFLGMSDQDADNVVAILSDYLGGTLA